MPGPLWPYSAAFNPPNWTLSVELHGSLLILALSALHRRSRRWWRIMLAIVTLVALRSPFLCFLAGHALAVEPRSLLPALKPDLLERGFGAVLLFVTLVRPGRLAPLLESGPARWLGRMSFPIYLAHRPVLFAPGTAVAVALGSLVPVGWAGFAGLAAGLFATFLVAAPIRRLDKAVLEGARRLRRALIEGRGPAPAPRLVARGSEGARRSGLAA